MNVVEHTFDASTLAAEGGRSISGYIVRPCLKTTEMTLKGTVTDTESALQRSPASLPCCRVFLMKDGIPSPPPSTFVLFFLDVYVRFVCVYGCVPHVYIVLGSQNPLKLEL